eukprot:TRINITY_DN3457_c0_g1_i7.p1 TRINITY_DN3457_c0_g1~~TRINITY_DN3457_c0_g1_i7.p1  ORF type:complete len:338 (+),score=71.81 TRINITY_DN3457_c0_g1_i7:58-1071(+)
MAALLFLFLASAFVGAVRVLNEENNVQCALLKNVYTDARTKTEASLKRGGDLSDKRNLDRLLRAAKSLKKALKADCDWATDLPKKSQEGDAPFLSKMMHSKLAERPCGDQALAIAKTGKIKEAMDALMAKDGECPAPEVGDADLAKEAEKVVEQSEYKEVSAFIQGSEVDVADVAKTAKQDVDYLRVDDAALAKTLKQVVEESDVDDADVGKTVLQETEEPDIDDAALVQEAELDVEESDADINIAERTKKAIEAAGGSLLEIGAKRGQPAKDAHPWFHRPHTLKEWAIQFVAVYAIHQCIWILLALFFPLGMIPFYLYALVVSIIMWVNLFRLALQ